MGDDWTTTTAASRTFAGATRSPESRADVSRPRARRLPERGHVRAAGAGDDRRGESRRLGVELERGRGGKPYFDNLIETSARVRGLFAELLGTAPEHVALTASTTMGCQIVLSGLRLEPGDEIVTTDEEHFGLLGPLHVSGARVRVAATRGRTGDEALEAVLAEVGPRTRLVALSHVSWMTGHILPVDDDQGRDGPAAARGRGAVGRRHPGRRGRRRLLHRLRAEVAVRPGRHGRAVRPRSGRAGGRAAHVLVA